MLIIGSGILFLFGMLVLSWQVIRFAYSLIKIAVLLVVGCVLIVVTGVLAVVVGCQQLTQLAVRGATAIEDWNWRRRYGEVLPPLPPE
jgi:hypothetical protein